MVRFSITSAKIIINGTTYNVTVPNDEIISAQLAAQTKVNSTSSILVDLTPTVVTVYTDNSTVFVLVPSVKAVEIGRENVTAKIGFRRNLSAVERKNLGHATPNITITGASLNTSQQNVTSFSVSVKNTGNDSVIINHVLVYGNDSTLVMPGFNVNVTANGTVAPITGRCITCPLGWNASGDYCVPICSKDKACPQIAMACPTGASQIHCKPVNTTNETNGFGNTSGCVFSVLNQRYLTTTGKRGGMFMTIGGNNVAMIDENSVANTQARNMPNIPAPGMGMGTMGYNQDYAQMGSLLRMGLEMRQMEVLNFLVAQNGTLELPLTAPTPMTANSFEGPGYVLSPGASATFTFSGSIELGNGHLRFLFLPGDTYKVVVSGEKGAVAHTNVTAV
jgi:hypothetical protein